MPKAKTLAALALLIFALPQAAQAGLNVYSADGPPPKLDIEQPKPLEYKVQKGDSAAAIAKKFGIAAKDLLAANGLADAKKLKAGQTLKIPGKTATPTPAPAPVAAAKAAPEAKPVMSVAASEKPDATARKAGKKEALDPGVEEEKPVKGKKGKKGKAEPIVATPAPVVQVDDKMRASFGKTGVITNNTDVPQAIRDEFLRYANKWVDELDRIGVGTVHNKKVRQVGGAWEATYRVIFRESMDYDHTPYVGHITYMQRVYTCQAPTKQAALAGPFAEKDEAVREIFSYSGKDKAWR